MFLPYAHQSIDFGDTEKVAQAMRQEYITRGENVQAFEQAVAKLVGAQYGVAFSSGSTALLAAYQAAHITADDLVVTTPNTFITTVSGPLSCSVQIRLVDIDSFGNGSIERFVEAVNVFRSRGRTFVVPVHFAGVAMDMRELEGQVRNPNTVIIEDAAHALGSSYPCGKRVGCCEYSDMTIFSFHAVKNITCGEGGMVMTNDPDLYARLKLLKNSGIEKKSSWYYEVEEYSLNFHMTEMQAALGLSQLDRIQSFQKKKKELFAAYQKRLANFPGLVPCADESERTLYHLFEISIDFATLGLQRESVMQELADLGIGTQYHYVPLYSHPVVQKVCGQKKELFPKMEQHFQQALSIPFFVDMKFSDVDRVVSGLRKVLFQLV